MRAANNPGMGPAATPRGRDALPGEPALAAHQEVGIHLRAGGGALRVVRVAGEFKRRVEAVN